MVAPSDRDEAVQHSHVSDADIMRFLARRMEPAGLVTFTGHLATCPACRERTALAPADRSSAYALVEALGLGDDAHVPEDDIHALVNGTLDESRRAEVDAHLVDCRLCDSEVRNLRAFADKVIQPRRRYGWTSGLAAAAVLLLGVALGLLWRSSAVTEVVRLADAGGVVSLDSRGEVHGVGLLDAGESARLRDALSTGQIVVSGEVTRLAGESGVLRSAVVSPAFGLVAPIGTVVPGPRPLLRWTARVGATGYVVTLRNERTGETVSGPSTTGLSWTPDPPLQPGETYSWQVSAAVGRSEEVAPAPPAPAARFRVVASAEAARLASLPASHLTRGVAYAHAGLLDEAADEFRRLAAQNPDSPLVQQFLRQLQAVPQAIAP